MFLSFLTKFFKSIINFFSIFNISKSPKNSNDIERIQQRRKYAYTPVGQEFEENEDETDIEIDTANVPLTMHKIEFKDKHGSLRFRLKYMPKRELLSVTILDAQDLPAMDSNGKSDPYVEVGLTLLATLFALGKFLN